MSKVVAYTTDYALEGKYAKLFTLYKSAFNITDWHNNQVVFTIFQFNSYKSYIEKTYRLSSYKGNSDETKIHFACISDDTANKLDCICKDNGVRVDVYVKGQYESVPVRMKLDYVRHEGYYTYYLYQPFDVDLTSDFVIPEKTGCYEVAAPAEFNGGYTINENYNSIFRVDGNKVTIDFVMKSGTYLGSEYNLTRFPANLPGPKVRYYNPIRYKGTDGEWYDGEIIINEYRDLIATCTKATEQFPGHIEYYF